jgi:hypothetical protein
MKTIGELQELWASVLRELSTMADAGTLPPRLEPLLHLGPPAGYDIEVALRHFENDRPVPRDASAESVDLSRCTVRISYSRATVESQRDAAADRVGDAALRDLIGVLDVAEREPRHHFVALKYLRDTLLPASGFAWAQDPEARQAAIEAATRSQCALTSKRPNPRNPQFPVTAIRLDRDHALVREALGTAPDADFAPIEIRGEPLSETILRERR